MKDFFKYVGATVVGLIIFGIIATNSVVINDFVSFI